MQGTGFMKKDLFEVLRSVLECEYISDLRFGETSMKARKLLGSMSLEEYTLQDLSVVAEYISGEHTDFKSYRQAKAFFGNKN